MRMLVADRRRYPELYNYIKVQVSKLKRINRIVRALETYGSLTAVEARSALSWGGGPLVVVRALSAGQCGVPAANGCFSAARPNEIQISRFRVNQLENASPARFDRTQAGKKVLIVGTTLLHELCHYGNKKSGTEYAEGEAGVDFETALYGRNTG
ncbi:hypothetical protein MNBD_GAMMA10-230 [hydrothermal vent metagenome]|uniref:Tox-MPTase3 domain-containing protein n=1 Tax=hydrothermal vent metagenome TaxID=652676 RepID=A0A3B0XCF2_9ZZZZ